MSLFQEKVELGIEEAEFEAEKALNNFPPLMRWIFLGLAILTIPTYYVAKAVSHNIWASNYAKTALSAKPSFTNPKTPSISPVTLTSLGPNAYNAVVLIGNPNLDLSLDLTAFEFDFFNAQKQLIYHYSDQLYLLPNQTKYIVAPRFSTTEQIAYANFVLPTTLPWQRRLNVPTVNFAVSVPSSFEQASPQGFVAQGDFFNNSPYNLKKIHLTFVVFDSNGKIVGASARDEFTVTPFERRSYIQLWPGISFASVSHIDVSADTDTLAPSNLALPDVQSSGAGNLNRPSTPNQ